MTAKYYIFVLKANDECPFRSQDMGKEGDDQKRTLAAWRAGVADKTLGTVNHRGVQ